MPPFELWHLPVTFLAGLVGEGYSTIVGSGGVLIQFTLATLGLPLAVVVATDIGGSHGADFGLIAASSKKIWSNKKMLIALGVPVLLGGIIGTLFLIYISITLLKVVLIVGLISLLIYTVFGKKTELQQFEDLKVNWRQYPLVFAVMFILGVYGNVSGVGVGTFKRFAYLSLLRIGFVDSLGISSIVVLPAGIFSIIVTAMSGLIAWPYFFMIFIGSFIGAAFVARHIRKVPESYLKTLLVIVITLYLLYLIYSLF